jgi:RNA recognition motif-containing protein
MREDGETDGDDRVVRVSNLTRIVNHKHLEEIFAHYGAVERVALERFRPDKGDENGGDTSNLRAGFVQYVRAGDATNAMSHMDGGQIDGKEVTLIRIAAVHV